MLKIKKALIFTVLFFCSGLMTCSTANAAELAEINDLIENSSDLDNTVVTIQGEAIGEALERGEYAWININDGSNAIGVWVKRSDIECMEFFGDYKNKGDTVEVIGVFHRACSEHGGDMDIHCTNIVVVETGHAVTDKITSARIITAAVLCTAAALTIVLYLRLVKKPHSGERYTDYSITK